MPYDPTRHLIRIQGNREYLPVAQRLVWFREAHPDWGIETKIEILDIEAGLAVFSATIFSETGKVMARATKMETARGFADYVEKAETGAIGRALALCGFGTQFAPELEEGDRIVDAPHPVGQPTRQAGQARAAAAPRGPAGSGASEAMPTDGNGSPTCSEPDCGRPMTRAQHEFSVRTHGRALCPICQKQHRAETAAAAAA